MLPITRQMILEYFKNKKKLKAKKVAFVVVVAAFALFWLIPFGCGKQKTLPRVYLGNNALSGEPLEKIQENINEAADKFEQKKFNLFFGNKKSNTSFVESGIVINRAKTGENLVKSLSLGSYAPKFFWRFWQNLIFGYRVPVYYSLDQNKLNEVVSKKFGQDLYLAEDASLNISGAEIRVSLSKEGLGIDEAFMTAQIVRNIKNWSNGDVEIRIVKIEPTVTTREAESLKNEISGLVAYPFVFQAGEITLSLPKEELMSWIKIIKNPLFSTEPVNQAADLETTINTTITGDNYTTLKQHYQLDWDVDEDKVAKFLDEKIKGKIYQKKINGVLAVENGVLTEIQSSRGETSVDIEKSLEIVVSSFKNSQYFIELPVVENAADVSLKRAQEIGANALVGRGESNFSGSPNNRRHNIRVGAGKFNGAVIEKGETFSFLKKLGPVDRSTGYLPELVIKKDKTIPEYGGGMCQVSTTCFRAAVNSGLRVVERQNHAYPVQYYSPQGTDATVYIPKPDLKFINDTPGPILIQTRIEGNLLYFEFFGQSDGRKVELEGPRTWDKKSDGSMKAEWIQRVYNEAGQLMFQKNFLSKYESPSKFPHPEDEKPPKEKKKKKKN